MSQKPEDNIVNLLQEMRKDVRDGVKNISTRIDGLANIITLLAGHNHNLERRVSTVEDILKTK